MSRALPRAADGLTALRDFAKVRLVALDIDGTLLSATTGKIGDVVRDLQSSLAHYRRGVRITLATGRTFAAARAVIVDLNLPSNSLVILYNGAVITSASGDRLWARRVMDPRTVEVLSEFGARSGLRTLIFSCESLVSSGYHENPCALAEFVLGVSSQRSNPATFGGLPVQWEKAPEQLPQNVAAILFEMPDQMGPDIVRNQLALERLPVAVSVSSQHYVEVSPVSSTKATALANLARSLGITAEQVAAVGDSENDVDMLKWAGIGVAVGNASPAALAASDFVTRHNAGDGVVEFLRLLRVAVRFRSVGV